jgi:hypothetical protein
MPLLQKKCYQEDDEAMLLGERDIELMFPHTVE